MNQTRTAAAPAGKITGLETDTHIEFRGIPYALPPLKTRRWHKPRPIPGQNEISALHFAPAGCQADMRLDPFYGPEFYHNEDFMPKSLSEDCLYLNIWMPKEPADQPYPVLVWFHGGAFDHGFSYELEFDGAGFARRGVILVTVGYRLGPFGFLYLPERVSQEGFSGNYGHYDQLEALNWVKKNIASFGGDPENITISGQSAGSFSVENLMQMADPGLFHKVILQSGCGKPGGMALVNTPEQAAGISAELMNALQVQTAAELEQLDSESIMKAASGLASRYSNLIYLPTADEKNLKADFHTEMGSLPALLGAVKDDIASSPDNPALLNEAKKMAEALGAETSYVYFFAHDLPGSRDGAWHSSELWYVFQTLDRCWRPFTPADYRLSDQIADHWAQFVKTGSPKTEKSPWPAWSKTFVKVFE